ncbi:molecular chaperone DnaK [Armatimonas sp.]|uniref:molecular chaperone DnaK n=1 Tax=Armatimonas sp. TaxID=1872638 RepID=UPI00286B5172|nr:molecular chaperone DnaK [Armatimonas sp.]
MGRIVGIDLGTTNSVVAVLEAGEPTVITLTEGSRLCPSVVGFSRDGERVVGRLAKRQAVANPEQTFASIKRYMGSDHRVFVEERGYSAPEISAMILQKLKADAEAYLGEPVDRAVITVPAYFNDGQRQATKDAGQIAGLEVLRIINEPTAAALAYGLNKHENETILVWDLGGGTFDVSILELKDGVFDVKATCGDTRLGGDDWDNAIVGWLAEEFQQEFGIDLLKDRLALQRLKEAAEKAKIELSAMLNTSINLPFISANDEGPLHLEQTLARAKFEVLTAGLRDKVRDPTYQVLNDARLAPQQLQKIVLVGGATRMPAIQDMVREIFQKDPFKGMNPDEVVAAGAAIQAGMLIGELTDLVLLDVTPLSLGIETLGGVMTRLIARNTTVPTSRTQNFTTATEGQSAVDIHVLQGEREMAVDNKSLGRFLLEGIPPAPRGVPKIEVLFDIDANGILHVSAKDSTTGAAQKIVVTAASGLSQEEVEQMVLAATTYAESDRQRRAVQEARNLADAALYHAEKQLLIAQALPQVSGERKLAIHAAMDTLRVALQGDSDEALATHTQQLNDQMYALSEAIYSRPTLPQEPSGAEEQPETEIETGETNGH